MPCRPLTRPPMIVHSPAYWSAGLLVVHCHWPERAPAHEASAEQQLNAEHLWSV